MLSAGARGFVGGGRAAAGATGAGVHLSRMAFSAWSFCAAARICNSSVVAATGARLDVLSVGAFGFVSGRVA